MKSEKDKDAWVQNIFLPVLTNRNNFQYFLFASLEEKALLKEIPLLDKECALSEVKITSMCEPY